MFDDKIVKLKKEQFIEAESIAYLINDDQKRKLSFVNNCALFAFKNYVTKNKYKYDPVTKINLFRVPTVYEKFEISDLYIGNTRFDVRVSLNGNVFPIPKVHIKNSIAADFYVVFKGTKNPLKCEALGYIKKDDLVFDSQDKNYYYISTSILKPIQDLKKETDSFTKSIRNFYETEHKMSIENFATFLDGELEESKTQDLIEHLLECEECRGLFVEYSFLEDVLSAVNHYPDLKDKLGEEIKQLEAALQEQPVELEAQQPVEETSIEEAPTEETQIEEIHSEETPSEEIPTEEAPAEETPVEENIIQEVPEEEAPVEETPAEENIIQEVPEEEVPVEETPAEENIIQEVPEEEVPVEETPVEESNIEPIVEPVIEPIAEPFAEPTVETPSFEENSQEELVNIQEEEEQINLDNVELNEEETLNIDEENIVVEPVQEVNEEPVLETAQETTAQGEQEITVQEENSQEETFDFSEASINEENISSEPTKEEVPQEEIHQEDNNEYIIVEEQPSLELVNEEESFVDANPEPIELANNNENDMLVINETETINITEPDNNIQEQNSGLELQIPENDNIQQNSEFSSETKYDNNWNELFTNNSSLEEQNIEPVRGELQNQYTEEPVNAIANKDIESIYNEENIKPDMSEQAVSSEIETSVKKNKKPLGVAIAVASAVIVISVAIAGFSFMGGKSKPTANNNTQDFTPPIQTSENSDINQSITNAFSNNQNALKVTNVSWLKNKNLEVTTELKEYLSALGIAIWDDLDNDIKTVQGYNVVNPTKIIIKINKKGEISNIINAESCGAEEVDGVILQSVKDAASQIPPSAYSITGKDINLILVVNF